MNINNERTAKRVRDRCYGVALTISKDPHSAEDIAQEIYLMVRQNIDRYNPELDFDTWVNKVAFNKTISEIRRTFRENRRVCDDSKIVFHGNGKRGIMDLIEDPCPNPLDEIIEQERVVARAEIVKGSISELPLPCRLFLTLRYFHGMPYQKIADVLGITVGTVKSRGYAARRKISELFYDRMTDL